jgi:tetrapyrrole methylase family protein/MazG family protein
MSEAPPLLPVVRVVGLGPGQTSLLPAASRDALLGADAAFLRTNRHPAAGALGHLASFDHLYEEAGHFEEVYRCIVEELVGAARRESALGRQVVYGVPGSPFVAEATVAMLRADPRVSVSVVPATSFLDLAWGALGVDPVESGVTLVDGTRCEVELAGQRGPFLVAQCWSADVLSRLKLALDGPDGTRKVVVLHHLGLADEQVVHAGADELDRLLEPDHLTSVFVEASPVPVAAEMARLDELVRTLRERCPWDREQTHGSLTRHLVEETYEVLDAIAEMEGSAGTGAAATAADHLEEELGDLLFQVFFHARLAAEAGWFSVADVARAVHDKLVGRHPHVFGDVTATSAGAVVANWERIKAAEKGRSSVTEGIPSALPALLLAAKLERKARALGLPEPTFEQRRSRLRGLLEELSAGPGRVGEALYELVALAVALGVDAEDALRASALLERDKIVALERADRPGT